MSVKEHALDRLLNELENTSDVREAIRLANAVAKLTNNKAIRAKVIKRIQTELDAAVEVQEVIRLSNTIARLSKNHPGTLGRPPKPKKPVVAAATPSKILTQVTESAVDQLCDGEKVVHHLVIAMEKRQREHKIRTGRELTKAERNPIWEELKASLSDREREALESLASQVITNVTNGPEPQA